MRKSILFLGAAAFQLPAILYAKKKGLRILTADNRPENPGHKLAERSFLVSTTEKAQLLELAKAEQVDAVLSYASDVGAPAAAYLAEVLELPGHASSTVEKLVFKHQFRAFLNESGLQKLPFVHFHTSTLPACPNALGFPFMVKPVDRSGSKGVTKVQTPEAWPNAWEMAHTASISGEVIAEKWVEKSGFQVCGDGYFQNGKIVFFHFGDGWYDNQGRSHAPYGETFPSSHSAAHLNRLKAHMEHILVAAGYQQGPINIDAFITPDGQPFVHEIAPRNGGNYLPRAIELNTGIDLVGAAVETALDRNFKLEVVQKHSTHFHACYMLHSWQSGILDGIHFEPELAAHIYETHPYIRSGESVSPFSSGSEAIGNLVLHFDTFEQMHTTFSHIRALTDIQLIQ